MDDLSVSKPPPSPPPDEGKGRPSAGKRPPARKRPPPKAPAKPPAPAPPAEGTDGSAPEHKLDLLV